MSQNVSEDELTTLLPDKTSTTLQYYADSESAKVTSTDDHPSNYVSFHAVSYEVTQRNRQCKKLMPKIILNNVRYLK